MNNLDMVMHYSRNDSIINVMIIRFTFDKYMTIELSLCLQCLAINIRFIQNLMIFLSLVLVISPLRLITSCQSGTLCINFSPSEFSFFRPNFTQFQN